MLRGSQSPSPQVSQSPSPPLPRSLFTFAFFGNSFSKSPCPQVSESPAQPPPRAPNTRASPRGTGCRPFCAGLQTVEFLESYKMKHLTPFIFGRHVHTTPNPIFLRFFPFSPECSFFARRTFLISLSNIYCVTFQFAGSTSTLPA